MLQQSPKKISVQLILTVLSGLGLLSYIIYKASHTSFTHDESYTYTHYVHQSFMDIISYKTPYLNNHILNTLCVKYNEEFFGSSEIALRLGSIIAFIIYSVFAILLFSKYCPKFMLPFYVILSFNPYLLDFFSLARGYGLSIAFMLMSIYYITKYFTAEKKVHLILFNVGAGLSVLSNFSMLNYYISALIAYNVISFLLSKYDVQEVKKSAQFFKLNKINIISFILLGMILYEPLRKISKTKLLDFGGKDGILSDTGPSVVYDLFYKMNVTDDYMLFFKLFMITVPLLTLILLLKKFVKRELDFFKTHVTLSFANLVLWLIVCFVNIQHFVLDNDYNMHRFALFFYVLFMVNFIFLILYFYTQGLKIVTFMVSYIGAILLCVNLYYNHSLSYYRDWSWDMDTKLIMQKLTLEHQKNPSKKVRLGINWIFEPCTNFYRYTLDLNWLNPTHRNGLSKNDDYYLLFVTDQEYQPFVNEPIVHMSEQSRVVLIKNPKK